MTEEQLGVARQTMVWHQNRFAYPAANTSFHQAYIEDLRGIGVEPGSVDVVVSNCVVNLSPRKDLVLSEAFRMLKPGGEFYVSDVVADRRLPKTIANDPLLFVECLGGALYEADFVSAARRAGFLDPRTVARSAISIQDPEIVSKLGTARFTSVTYRLFKLQELDEQCEDYGQSAVYQGGLEGAEALFWLDDQHAFEVGRAERICGNTAKMLAKTRFARWFRIAGSHSVHFGTFPCGLTLAAQQYQSTEQESCC
jgi:SAM-dependent methyltransferase